MATTMDVTEARKWLGTIVEQVQREGESYIVSRDGEPVAALVLVRVYEDWQRHQRETFFDLVRDLQQEADLSTQEADVVAREAMTVIRDND